MDVYEILATAGIEGAEDIVTFFAACDRAEAGLIRYLAAVGPDDSQAPSDLVADAQESAAEGWDKVLAKLTAGVDDPDQHS